MRAPRTLVGYRWRDRSGKLWDTTKGEREGILGFEFARARGSVVGFERVFSLPVFEVVGVKDVSAAEGEREGSENEAAEGVSACGLDAECAPGACGFGSSACGYDGGCPVDDGAACGDMSACGGCSLTDGAPAGAGGSGDGSLSVGEAARLLGDSVVRAARERGGELRAAYDALSDPDFAAGLDWRTLQDRKTGRVCRNIRWERAGSRRRVGPTGVPVPRSSWDGVEARAAVRRARHDVAVSLARLARAVNNGADPLDDERM